MMSGFDKAALVATIILVFVFWAMLAGWGIFELVTWVIAQ